MDEREKNLPKWAQDLIKRLRIDREQAAETLTREVVRLRPQVEQLKAERDALREMLECAARGGHVGAREIVAALDGHSLTLVKEE